MKNYPLGLGAMLAGARLMFVLTNGEVSASKNVSGLVSLLNGCQVVRMMELLGLFGCVEYIRGQGDWVVCLNY